MSVGQATDKSHQDKEIKVNLDGIEYGDLCIQIKVRLSFSIL